jgi:nitrite reductase/ring-hydroxylating ferredoxin subunit
MSLSTATRLRRPPTTQSPPPRTSSRATLRAARARRASAPRCTTSDAAPAAAEEETSFVPVLLLKDIPKGSRKLVSAGGKTALVFWYREQLYAVEPRSPASGAYSDGFISARFTQDGCIECPQTDTTFDLKSGEIRSWYPNNPVLRAITPTDTCRPMETFPVRISEAAGPLLGETVEVDFENSNLARAGVEVLSLALTSGGADSSVERNNVYGIEPREYVQDGSEVGDDGSEGSRRKPRPATLIAGFVAVVAVVTVVAALARLALS